MFACWAAQQKKILSRHPQHFTLLIAATKQQTNSVTLTPLPFGRADQKNNQLVAFFWSGKLLGLRFFNSVNIIRWSKLENYRVE